MQTETYVVRVYRRSGNSASARPDSSSLVGVVEIPDNGEKRSFHGIDELWRILAHPESVLTSESLPSGTTQP
jgi:hypothetical protein